VRVSMAWAASNTRRASWLLTFQDAAHPVYLAQLMPVWRQLSDSPGTVLAIVESGRHVDRRAEGDELLKARLTS
jgi:hypothetical protein